MLFHPRQKIMNTDDNMIKINNYAVPLYVSTKYLGMYIDNNFTWIARTKHINKFFYKGVGVLSCLRNELPHKILLLIYNILILPCHTWGCITLGIAYNSNINKMITTRKKAFHIILNLPTYCHSSPFSKNLGLLNIHQHIQYHALIFMFQQQNTLLPNLYEEKFIIANKYHTNNTRNSKSLRSTFFILVISKNSIFFQGVKIWNNIPSEHKIITSNRKYMIYFKSHRLNKSYTYAYYFNMIN